MINLYFIERTGIIKFESLFCLFVNTYITMFLKKIVKKMVTFKNLYIKNIWA